MFRALIAGQGLAADGEQVYTASGSYSFTVPASVNSISAVLIGGGGGGSANFYNANDVVEAGSGGSLVYATFLVTAGETLTVAVGAGGSAGPYSLSSPEGGHGSSTTISRGGTLLFRAPGGAGGANNTSVDTVFIDGDALSSGSNSGGIGGEGTENREGNGGGGAAGYSGSGGSGGDWQQDAGGSGSGGGAGGGVSGAVGGFLNSLSGSGGMGGGTAIFGEGANGSGGSTLGASGGVGSSNSGVSGGTTGYGGGGSTASGARHLHPDAGYGGSAGDHGAVRLIWPGQSRQYPSTNTY